jgi:hypothetical protein
MIELSAELFEIKNRTVQHMLALLPLQPPQHRRRLRRRKRETTEFEIYTFYCIVDSTSFINTARRARWVGLKNACASASAAGALSRNSARVCARTKRERARERKRGRRREGGFN